MHPFRTDSADRYNINIPDTVVTALFLFPWLLSGIISDSLIDKIDQLRSRISFFIKVKPCLLANLVDHPQPFLPLFTGKIDNINSIYWWDGEIQDDREVVLIAKTKASLVSEVIEKVKSIHSYDCPCIVSLPILDGNKPFLEWVGDETK